MTRLVKAHHLLITHIVEPVAHLPATLPPVAVILSQTVAAIRTPVLQVVVAHHQAALLQAVPLLQAVLPRVVLPQVVHPQAVLPQAAHLQVVVVAAVLILNQQKVVTVSRSQNPAVLAASQVKTTHFHNLCLKAMTIWMMTLMKMTAAIASMTILTWMQVDFNCILIYDNSNNTLFECMMQNYFKNDILSLRVHVSSCVNFSLKQEPNW